MTIHIFKNIGHPLAIVASKERERTVFFSRSFSGNLTDPTDLWNNLNYPPMANKLPIDLLIERQVTIRPYWDEVLGRWEGKRDNASIKPA